MHNQARIQEGMVGCIQPPLSFGTEPSPHKPLMLLEVKLGYFGVIHAFSFKYMAI